jgi:uncharacterized protein YjiS (DUF1127 family)
MTISQSCTTQGSEPVGGFLSRMMQRFARWRAVRRANADLDRLAQVGDYMLRDIGLDPKEPRPDASAILDRPRRPPIA